MPAGVALRVLLGSALIASCGTAESDPGLSALLITLDTTRADGLSCYGGPPELTPHVGRLAEEGVLYEYAHTVAPLTQPAHASMLTGLYPPRHSVRDNGIWALPDSAETSAEAAARAGIRTAAFLGSVVLDAGFGFEQGFEVYEPPARPLAQTTTDYAERRGSEVAASAAHWLAGLDPGERFFLWVHLWDPHGPYEPPAEFADRGTPYQGELAAMDAAVGTLLESLRSRELLERTLVLLVADHGEAFGEHDEVSHGALCYEPTLHVPLVVRYPDAHRAGERSREIVSVVDVHPTLCAALGLPAPIGVDGESLHRTRVAPDRGVYFESYYGYLAYGWSPLAGWLDRGGKYVHGTVSELFDPLGDPVEARDLVGERDVTRYRAEISAVFERPALARDEGALDEGLRDGIRALGYAAAASAEAELPHGLAETGRTSPRAATGEQKLYQRACALLGAGRTPEARRDFEAILEHNPENVAARERLAICLSREGDAEAAIEHLRRIVSGGHAHADTHFFLAAVLARDGRDEEAVEHYARALDVDRNHVQALTGIVEALERLGRGPEARPYRASLRALRERR